MCFAIAIVVDDQGAFDAYPIGIGEDIFIDRAGVMEKVIEQEVIALRKKPPAIEQGRNLALVALYEPPVWPLIVAGPLIFHAVLLSESLDLPVAKHGQSGQGGHQRGHAEAFITNRKS